MSKKFRELKEKFESRNNIVRVQKSKDNPYVMINKSALNDVDLSWAAKGLHSYLLSLPDDWEIYVKELVKHTSSGRDHTYSVINELLANGYMEKTQYRCEGKVVGLNYTVFEVSTGEDNTKTKISNVTLNDNGEIVEISTIEPNTDIQETENPNTDFTKLLINNNTNNNKLKNKEVVVVDEKQTKLLEMYKTFKLEKKVMPQTTKLLRQYADKFDLEVFEQIFISASEDSVLKKYPYIKTVLEALDAKNIKTLADYEKDNAEYKANKTSKKSNTYNKSNSDKDYKVKTRFHNITDRTAKYTPEELNNILANSQAAKQAEKEAIELKEQSKEVAMVEITKTLIDECMRSKDYFNSLDEVTKAAIKESVKSQGGFIPGHLQ